MHTWKVIRTDTGREVSRFRRKADASEACGRLNVAVNANLYTVMPLEPVFTEYWLADYDTGETLSTGYETAADAQRAMESDDEIIIGLDERTGYIAVIEA